VKSSFFSPWLNFKSMVAFSSKQAPVVQLSGTLAQGESLFLIQLEVCKDALWL
jgi:hypothetical protein